MPNDPITLDDLMGAIIADRKESEARHEQVMSALKQGAEERQAIRDVVDNDLAGQGQVMALEGQVKEIARTVKRLEKQRA